MALAITEQAAVARRDADDVVKRISRIMLDNVQQHEDRETVRAVMAGGSQALRILLGDDMADEVGKHLPAVNIVRKAIDKAAAKLGALPTVKVQGRENNGSDKEAKRAYKKQRIIDGYDVRSDLIDGQPEVARWLLGYGFVAFSVFMKRDRWGIPYPHAEPRNPHDVYTNWFAQGQQPESMTVRRYVDEAWIKARFSEHWDAIALNSHNWSTSISDGGYSRKNLYEIHEYSDVSGIYTVLPGAEAVIDYMPSPLVGSVPFVVDKLPSFDGITGKAIHVVGLMTSLVKISLMNMIAMEDSVFRETNIIGQMLAPDYDRGRFAVNHFEQGTQVTKPQGDIAFQTFQQADRLERAARVEAGYPESEDGKSPTSFATGKGIEALRTGSTEADVSEVQRVFSSLYRRLDQKRLELDEYCYPDLVKNVSPHAKPGTTMVETYTPAKDINGAYATTREYGLLAGLEEQAKIVAHIQIASGGGESQEDLIDAIHGSESEAVRNRITSEGAQGALNAILQQKAAEGDPKAMMVLNKISKDPQDVKTIIETFYDALGAEPSPEEQAMLAQEQAMMAQGGGGMPGGPPGESADLGPPPSVTSVLSRVLSNGAADGGVQTVNTI